jgi:hypothetical protein
MVEPAVQLRTSSPHGISRINDKAICEARTTLRRFRPGAKRRSVLAARRRLPERALMRALPVPTSADDDGRERREAERKEEDASIEVEIERQRRRAGVSDEAFGGLKATTRSSSHEAMKRPAIAAISDTMAVSMSHRRINRHRLPPSARRTDISR